MGVQVSMRGRVVESEDAGSESSWNVMDEASVGSIRVFTPLVVRCTVMVLEVKCEVMGVCCAFWLDAVEDSRAELNKPRETGWSRVCGVCWSDLVGAWTRSAVGPLNDDSGRLPIR